METRAEADPQAPPGRSRLRAIGLMSGTSRDGVDAALIESDGETIAARGAWLTLPYAPERRALLERALAGEAVAAAERMLTEAHAEAVFALLRAAARVPEDIDVIGFHGHTLWHRPDEGRSLQIGDGGYLAAITGIDVVNDFRSNDLAAGGQGAPLVPLFHRALAHGLEKPLAVLNIGGVANVTWIGPEGRLLAFDTGPGCAALDDWALAHNGEPLDRDGRLAAAGRPDEARLARWLDEAYFAKAPPKSLDRQDFTAERARGLAPADGAATLAAFTARAAARAARHFPLPARRWLVTGGGRHHPGLMAELARSLAPVAAMPAEAAGFEGDAIEAQAFGFLAIRSLMGLPLTLPATTGAARPVCGGRLHRAAMSV